MQTRVRRHRIPLVCQGGGLTSRQGSFSSMRNPVERRLVKHPSVRSSTCLSHYEKGEPGPIEIDALCGENVPASNGNSRKRQNPHPLQKVQWTRHPECVLSLSLSATRLSGLLSLKTREG